MSAVKLLLAGLMAALVVILPATTQEPKFPALWDSLDKDLNAQDEDEQILSAAGIPMEGPGLLELFRARARTDVKAGQIEELCRRLSGSILEDRVQASTDLVILGPLAVPALRRIANDLDAEDVREQARRVLTWVEGPQSARLITAAARVTAKRKPDGAAEALLGYVPFADNDEVSKEVTTALRAVAVVKGKAEPVLVRALSDAMPLKRMVAAVVLSQTAPEERQNIEKLLADTNPEVRLGTALALAKAHHAPAVPVLIELLAALPAKGKRGQIEEFLQELAGEWAPIGGPTAEDEIARRIRRDAWAAWWANTDGPALQEMLRKRTLTPEEQKKVQLAIKRLGDQSYTVREKAIVELVARGRMILPLLRETLKNNEREIVLRAQQCIRRIEEEPANRLPLAAPRMLALRKPPAAAETLLAYLPFAEEEVLGEVQSALTMLAVREGKPELALMDALAAARPTVRAAAAEALAKSGDKSALPAVRKLLDDADVTVRLRTAIALAPRDTLAVPVLIDLMAGLPAEQAWQVHDFLTPLAGEKAPPGPTDDTADARKKSSAAWSEWWKANAKTAELSRLVNPQLQVLGYTVVCEHNTGRITELGRDRKPRWSFGGTNHPVDAWVLPNNRVVVAEYSGNCVTERDLKGNVIWRRQVNGSPHNVQRLPNGNIFITTNVQMVEVDRKGKDVHTLPSPQGQQLTGGYRARNGDIICMSQNGVCYHLDAKGKQLKTFTTNRGGAWMDLLPNGRIVIAENGGSRVTEYDPDGKSLVELNVNNVSTATGLPNGNFLVTCHGANRVVEMDRKGKMVWEYSTQGPFRSRGR